MVKDVEVGSQITDTFLRMLVGFKEGFGKKLKTTHTFFRVYFRVDRTFVLVIEQIWIRMKTLSGSSYSENYSGDKTRLRNGTNSEADCTLLLREILTA